MERSDGGELTGKVVVVPVGWAPAAGLAQRLAGRGATVVLVGPDAEEVGRLAGAIEGAARGTGGSARPAVFVADGSDAGHDALAAFVAELFRSP